MSDYLDQQFALIETRFLLDMAAELHRLAVEPRTPEREPCSDRVGRRRRVRVRRRLAAEDARNQIEEALS